MAAKHSIENSYFYSISTDFNNPRNLVRDQGVGGSNPLSPTIKINNLQPFYPDQEIQCRRFCSGQSLQVQQTKASRGAQTQRIEIECVMIDRLLPARHLLANLIVLLGFDQFIDQCGRRSLTSAMAAFAAAITPAAPYHRRHQNRNREHESEWSDRSNALIANQAWVKKATQLKLCAWSAPMRWKRRFRRRWQCRSSAREQSP